MNIFKNITSLYRRLVGTYHKKPVETVALATDVVALATDVVALATDVVALATDVVALATEDALVDWVIIDEADYARSPLKQGAIEAEHLAKVSAYKLAVPRIENPDSEHAAKHELRTKGYELEPLGSEELRSQNGIYLYAMVKPESLDPINIVCRGTAGDASIVADLDPNGPGHGAMKANRELLMQQVNELARKYPSRKIRVTGHSLGGSLAQILTTDILEERVKAYTDETTCACPELKGITSLETVLFQSASVNDEVAQHAFKYAHHMKMIDPNFEINLVAHIKQGDFVSRTGGYIFANIDPDVASVYMDFRAIDKPWVTLKDALDVGFVAFTTGGAPIPMVISAATTVSSRYVSNRVAAHRDFFYHYTPDRTFSTLLPEDHAYLSNASTEERNRILHVFTKNDLKYVPMHDKITRGVYNSTQHFNNNDVKAVAVCLSSVAIAVPKICEVASSATRGPVSGVMSAAKHLPAISVFANNVCEHGSRAASAVQKIFGS